MTTELSMYTLYRSHGHAFPEKRAYGYTLCKGFPEKPSLVTPLPPSVSAPSLAELAEAAVQNRAELGIGKGIDKLTTIPAPVVDVTFGGTTTYQTPASVNDLLDFQVLFAKLSEECKANDVFILKYVK